MEAAGFTLIEALAALLVLSFGLLAGGQLICIAVHSRTLAHCKAAAAIAAQGKMEFLAALYDADPTDTALSYGTHGPEEVTVTDPSDGRVLNRFAVVWETGPVADPRPGKEVRAVRVTVRVTPLGPERECRLKPWLNKEVHVTGIFAPKEVR